MEKAWKMDEEDLLLNIFELEKNVGDEYIFNPRMLMQSFRPSVNKNDDWMYAKTFLPREKAIDCSPFLWILAKEEKQEEWFFFFFCKVFG